MDLTAFTNLVRQHRKLIHKISGAYCRNVADRDDVAQEIILQLWRSRHGYDSGRRASTWIYRIALNVAISFYRRERRHTERRLTPEETLITVAATPEAEPDEDVQVLQRCMAELDEMNRALLLLYLDGNDHASIAEILGISVSNVGTKLSRIKKMLKRAFERHAPKA